MDIVREIYKFKIGKMEFKVSLHAYRGLVLNTKTSITTEVLHSQIYYLEDYIGKGRRCKGWCILRWHDEVSDDISDLSKEEREMLSKEMGWEIFDSWEVISRVRHLSANEGFFSSNCLNQLLQWIEKHPIVFKRYYEVSSEIRDLMSKIEYYKKTKSACALRYQSILTTPETTPKS